MIELNEWCESSVEHPNDSLFEGARDKFARLVTLVDALHTLGPPLSHDELDELRATNWSLSVGIED